MSEDDILDAIDDEEEDPHAVVKRREAKHGPRHEVRQSSALKVGWEAAPPRAPARRGGGVLDLGWHGNGKRVSIVAYWYAAGLNGSVALCFDPCNESLCCALFAVRGAL